MCDFDTPTICNAIEQFNVRLRNEGFTNTSIHCRFPRRPPVAGYAVTGRVRSSMPPMTGRCYYQRADWWRYVASVPEPRFIVLQDADHTPGLGALFGEIHVKICLALNCVACLTNGSVRDVTNVEPTGFQFFSGSIGVSHSYAHIVDFGDPVEIGGLKISPGDLLHGDRHGVVQVPADVVPNLADKADEMLQAEACLMQFCASPSFSLQALEQMFEETEKTHGC